MDLRSWGYVVLVWLHHPWKISKAILRWMLDVKALGGPGP